MADFEVYSTGSRWAWKDGNGVSTNGFETRDAAEAAAKKALGITEKGKGKAKAEAVEAVAAPSVVPPTPKGPEPVSGQTA